MMALMVSSNERPSHQGSPSHQAGNASRSILRTHSLMSRTEDSHLVRSSDHSNSTNQPIRQNNPSPDALIFSGIPGCYPLSEYHSNSGTHPHLDTTITSRVKNVTLTTKPALLPRGYPLVENPNRPNTSATENHTQGYHLLANQNLPDTWTMEHAKDNPQVGEQNQPIITRKKQPILTLYHCRSEERLHPPGEAAPDHH
jgi:hypothetical protein